MDYRNGVAYGEPEQAEQGFVGSDYQLHPLDDMTTFPRICPRAARSRRPHVLLHRLRPRLEAKALVAGGKFQNQNAKNRRTIRSPVTGHSLVGIWFFGIGVLEICPRRIRRSPCHASLP